MYNHRKVSLILPTYREKDSIRQVIREFEALALIDEILVINNNAIEGTSEEVGRRRRSRFMSRCKATVRRSGADSPKRPAI